MLGLCLHFFSHSDNDTAHGRYYLAYDLLENRLNIGILLTSYLT